MSHSASSCSDSRIEPRDGYLNLVPQLSSWVTENCPLRLAVRHGRLFEVDRDAPCSWRRRSAVAGVARTCGAAAAGADQDDQRQEREGRAHTLLKLGHDDPP